MIQKLTNSQPGPTRPFNCRIGTPWRSHATRIAHKGFAMKCSACNRTLTRSAFSVGKLDFGPICFKKLVAEGHRAKKVDLRLVDPGDLLSGCYFDQQGAADRAALVGGNP